LHSQDTGKRTASVAIRKTSRLQLLFGNVRCRLPETIFLPPELTNLLAELGQFSSFVGGELTLLRRAEITAINTGLTDRLGQADV
jgi:hypothetical protein